MTFTKNGERYFVIDTPWSGVWIVGEYGKAYRRLPSGYTGT